MKNSVTPAMKRHRSPGTPLCGSIWRKKSPFSLLRLLLRFADRSPRLSSEVEALFKVKFFTDRAEVLRSPHLQK